MKIRFLAFTATALLIAGSWQNVVGQQPLAKTGKDLFAAKCSDCHSFRKSASHDPKPMREHIKKKGEFSDAETALVATYINEVRNGKAKLPR